MDLKLIESKNYHGQKANFYIREGLNDQEIIEDVRMRNFYLDSGFGVFTAGDQVIDIGGHIGAFAIECAVRGARVLTFEPDDENYTILGLNIIANGLQEKIIALRSAVSSRKGKATFYRDKKNPGSHSLIADCIDNGIRESLQVETVTLDEIIKGPCKLLKLDCEGSEYDILIGSDLSKVEKIVAELHIRERNEELVRYLEQQGYDIKWHFGERLGKLQGVKKNTI